MSEQPAPCRGEIWQVDFNPARSSEQAGRRPALILQNDHGNESVRYPNTIVVAMSTRGREIPLHIPIEPAPGNGLREVTWIKCEQILTLAKARLIGPGPMGRLKDGELARVDAAVKLSLGLA